jgi:hypothetical protein
VAFVGRDGEEARASLRREAERWGVAVEEPGGGPHRNPRGVCAGFEALRRPWGLHIVILFPYGREVEGLRLMGREVLGKLNND